MTLRLLVITGSHRRHVWFTSGLAELFEIAGLVAMLREGSVPQAPEGTSAHDRANFDRHFRVRDEVEAASFGDDRTTFASLPTLEIRRDELNGPRVADFARTIAADACVVFGADIITDPLASVLPSFTLNVHLGLSPWYRGTATLFWPFYNMEPHWAGATLHLITPQVDAGPIVHQCVPELRRGDGIHDVAARTVAVARDGVIACLERVEAGLVPREHVQRTTGRLYLTRQFRPEHLRVNYDLFDDRMVDAHLDAAIARSSPPKLIEVSGAPQRDSLALSYRKKTRKKTPRF
jgi:folate-dependent phosphoribosylglycinamide formyltransferase PurN